MVLQDIAHVTSGNVRPSNATAENGDFILLRLKNLGRNNKLTFENPLMVNATPQTERLLVQQGDVLFVCAVHIDIIGNVYKYNLPMKVVAGSNIAIIRAIDEANQELIYTVLKQHYYHFKHIANVGAAMPRISLRQLKEFEW